MVPIGCTPLFYRPVGVQTFLLKVTRRNTDDTTSIVKTVPCFGSNTDTCLVEVSEGFSSPSLNK